MICSPIERKPFANNSEGLVCRLSVAFGWERSPPSPRSASSCSCPRTCRGNRPLPHRLHQRTARSAAKSQRRRDRRRSPEHDGAARHHGAAARAERQRIGAQPRQLRRGARQSVSEPAGSPDAEERQEGHERGRVVEAAAAGDCRGVRSRSPRARAEERAEGHVGRQPHRELHGRRTAGRRQGARRQGRQLFLPGDHRRHPDDGRHAGGRDEAGAGDDDVRRAVRDAAGARRSSASRRAVSALAGGAPPESGDAGRSAGDRAAHRRRLGLRDDQPRQHPGGQRRRADRGHHRPGQQGPAAQAGRLGLAARVGVGRVARARLPRDRQGRGREEGRHRRRVALRQGGAGDDGLRPALRGGAGRLVGRRRRQAASPELRRSGREPHRLGRVSLDGRQLPEVRRGRSRRSAARTPATSRSTPTS